MKTHFPLWLLAVLSAALLSGCRAKTALPGAGSPDVMIPNPPAPLPEPVFQVAARADKTEFKSGEPIEFTLQITNVSTETAALNFTSGQKFDVSATRPGEADLVWSYGMNKRFIQSLQTLSLEAGKSLSFQTVWNGAAPGNYTIRALIKANGDLEAAPFQIVVK